METPSLEDRLAGRGLRIVDTVIDGNCFFDALRISLNLPKSLQEIRQRIVDTIPEMLDLIIVNLSGSLQDQLARMMRLRQWIIGSSYSSWDDYYAYMGQNENWADDPCIWAAVMVYNVKIEVIVDSMEGTRTFNKLPSWEKGSTTRSIILGNYHNRHYVATVPLDRLPRFGGSGDSGGSGGSGGSDGSDDSGDSGGSGGSGSGGSSGSKGSRDSRGSGSEESDTSDMSDDMVNSLLEKKESLTLKQMYAETFDVEMGDVSELYWTRSIGCSLAEFLLGGQRYVRAEPGFAQDPRGEDERKVYIMENIGFLGEIVVIVREKDHYSELSRRFQEAIISLDYCHSVLNWEEYKNDFLRDRDEEETKTLYNRLVNNYFKESCEKVINGMKKQSLKKCIAMAIKIGLNYQELEKFKVDHIQKVLMDATDARKLGITLTPITLKQIREYYGDEVVPRGTWWAGDKPFKEYKVKRSDLESSPYWEGIPVEYDLGDAVSLSKLTMKVPNVYINRTKRETLLKIYDTFGEYNVNLDTATPDQLKKLCDLKTPRLAPEIHTNMTCFFEGGENNMENLYDEWMQSDRSVKLFRGDLAKPPEEPPYISATEIPRAGDTSVSDIIRGDFTNIGTLISTGNPVSNAAIVADPVDPTYDPVDANFARQLSDAFVELGFLPRGSEEYCGVKALNKRQRGASKEESDKRQRTELFTAIEIH